MRLSLWAPLSLLLACLVAPATPASAQTVYSVIASLDGNAAPRRLMGGVIKAPNGSLYGTGYEDGTLPFCGGIYKVDPAGTLTIIHTFNKTDGCNPVGELVVGPDGHIYGTTFTGGPNTDSVFFNGTGTIFRMSMPGEVVTTLHAFGPRDPVTLLNPEGARPYAGLTLGPDNNLYGTTSSGGSGQCGTIFRITPAGTFTMLYALRLDQDGCAPQAGLTLSPDGNFYGTTVTGGGGAGSVFRITTAGVFTKRFVFALDVSCNCYSKGYGPFAEPVDDGAGYLWGTTLSGGGPAATGVGTIWKLNKNSGELTVVKAFSTPGSDGSGPRHALTLASDGYFYGTTYSGGNNSQGTLFRVSPAGVHEVLHHFTSATGIGPDGRLIEPEPGVIIGTTQLGGSLNGGGVVFRRGPGALMALDKTSLVFGAVTTGASLTFKTSAQPVRLTQASAGTGPVTWTATPSHPWLQVNPSSGSGSATLSLSIVHHATLPLSGSVAGSVTLTFNGSLNSPGPIAIKLNLLSGASQKPFGVIDTPIDLRTGVTGSVPFTGWALDDIEMSRVMICRDAVAAEVAPIDPNCAGARQIFVGFPVFIDLARPDLATTYPEIPLNTRGGWGLMVLTNMLPNQGNGTYRFHFWAQDREGNTQLLGTRTITCDNAHGTLPFGAIDTPEQGGLASGAGFANFGWALTPPPKIIPVDGSTITVVVDGTPVGNVTYNNFRSDIADLFPGYRNTGGAIGFRVLDTTAMANGSHTIAWIVTDSDGKADGIGSRYFSVSNGVGSVTAAASAHATAANPLSADDLELLPHAATSVMARRGWDLERPLTAYQPDQNSRILLRGEEIDRFEVHLGSADAAAHTGYLRVAGDLGPLPVGSALDQASGRFTWAPGVGFVGSYDLVFIRWEGGRPIDRREIRIALQAKGRGAVGPQVVIDTPRSQQDVAQPFAVAGWAADLGAGADAGIATIHAWAYPLAGGPPVFLGAVEYGMRRPDVAAVHGQQFRDSGFGLVVNGLTHGNYDLWLFPWSTVTGKFEPPTSVRLTVR